MAAIATAALILIAALLMAWASWRLGKHFARMDARIAALEKSATKRLPFGATDNIMDALANLNTMMFEEEVRMAQIETARAKLLKVMGENKKKGGDR